MSICPKNKHSKARRDSKRANWKMTAPGISAAEDIGLANPNALLLANAAFDAVMKIGSVSYTHLCRLLKEPYLSRVRSYILQL